VNSNARFTYFRAEVRLDARELPPTECTPTFTTPPNAFPCIAATAGEAGASTSGTLRVSMRRV
jgi:hypothetical protein